MSVFAISPMIILVSIVVARPWKSKSMLRRLFGVAGVVILSAVTLFAALGGIPSFLRAEFGLFISIDDYGPRSIIATDHGYVAVGDDVNGNAVVWLSEAGDRWSRIPHEKALERLEVGDVLTTSNRLVMVAHDESTGSVVALTSKDGLGWTRAGIAPVHGMPVALATNGINLAVVGESFSSDSAFWSADSPESWSVSRPEPHTDTGKDAVDLLGLNGAYTAAINQKSNALIFESEDGTNWTEITRFGDSDFGSLAIIGRTALAVGFDRDTKSGAIWASEDGGEWKRLSPPNEFDGTRLDLAVSNGEELVIFGNRLDDDTIVSWRTYDGAAWEGIPVDFGDFIVRDAAFGQDGIVLVGVDRALNSAAIFTSTDGRNWDRIPHDELLFAVR